jgi:hypothetical protein
MDFLEKHIKHSADKKKVVSARVSEVVITALNNAEKDKNMTGYTFSVSRILERALNDTLNELKRKTAINYYKLVGWQRKMEGMQTELAFDGLEKFFDFDKEIVKLKEGILATEDLESIDFDTILEMHEERIFGAWNHNLQYLKIDATVLSDGRIAQEDLKG